MSQNGKQTSPTWARNFGCSPDQVSQHAGVIIWPNRDTLRKLSVVNRRNIQGGNPCPRRRDISRITR